MIGIASRMILKKLKITDPSKESKTNVINAAKESFFATSIFSCLGNLSGIKINIGEIPIGFIRAYKVVRQKKKMYPVLYKFVHFTFSLVN